MERKGFVGCTVMSATKMKQKEFIQLALQKILPTIESEDKTIIIAYVTSIMQVSEVLIELEILEKN